MSFDCTRHYEVSQCQWCWRERIEGNITLILEGMKKMADQFVQLNTEVSEIETDETTIASTLTGVQTDVAKVITDLQNAQSGGTPVDITAALARLSAVHTNIGGLNTTLQGMDVNLKAADTTAKPPAPPAGTPAIPAA